MQPHLYLLAIIAGTFSLSTSGDQVLVFSGSEAGVSVVWFQGKPRGKHVLFPWKMDRMVVPKFRVYSPICGSVGKWWSIIGFGAAFFSSATGESQLFVWPQLWQQLPEELRAMLTFSPSFHRWVVSFWAVNRRNILTRKYAYVYIYTQISVCVLYILIETSRRQFGKQISRPAVEESSEVSSSSATYAPKKAVLQDHPKAGYLLGFLPMVRLKASKLSSGKSQPPSLNSGWQSTADSSSTSAIPPGLESALALTQADAWRISRLDPIFRQGCSQ